MILEAGDSLSVSGPMTVETARELDSQGGILVVQRDRVIDFSGVTQVDSAAIAVLLAWLRHAHSAGRSLRFVNLPHNVMSLARLYAIDEILPQHFSAE